MKPALPWDRRRDLKSSRLGVAPSRRDMSERPPGSSAISRTRFFDARGSIHGARRAPRSREDGRRVCLAPSWLRSSGERAAKQSLWCSSRKVPLKHTDATIEMAPAIRPQLWPGGERTGVTADDAMPPSGLLSMKFSPQPVPTAIKAKDSNGALAVIRRPKLPRGVRARLQEEFSSLVCACEWSGQGVLDCHYARGHKILDDEERLRAHRSRDLDHGDARLLK
jgi:hypothetical protein